MSVGLPFTRYRMPTATTESAGPASSDSAPIGVIYVDRLGSAHLFSDPARKVEPVADMVAIIPADQVEDPPRLQPDGTLAHPWGRLHGLIQDELSGLWRRVRQGGRGRLTRSGLVSTPKFPMFSYRAFHRRSFEEEDPIIAGVEVWLKPDGYKVLGEICGEESGESYYDEDADASRDPVELERVVGAIARRLADQVEVVAAALDES